MEIKLFILIIIEQTEHVIEAAGEIKRTGATGAYTQQFDATEKKLDEVNQLLQNTTKSSLDLGDIDKHVEMFR